MILAALFNSKAFHNDHKTTGFNTNVADRFSSDASDVSSNVKLLKDWLEVSSSCLESKGIFLICPTGRQMTAIPG